MRIKNLVLNEEEEEYYIKIQHYGNMDMMFELGYCIGQERACKEGLEQLNLKK